MALLQNVVAKGTHAARPGASSAGVLYFETDTGILFRDNGTTWDQIAFTSAPPIARARNSANISCANNASTIITLDTTDIDQGTASPQHSTSTNTSRLTCQAAGVYAIHAYVRTDGATSGAVEPFLYLNGGTVIGDGLHSPGNTQNGGHAQALYHLNVNDYVEIGVFHNVGGAINAYAVSAYTPVLEWALVG